MVLFHAILKSRQSQTICRRWQIYYIIMIPSRRFTVSQEETSCMYMPLLHQVMKWNTSCTQLLIHFPALSAAAAIQSYHVLKILKDYGYRSLHKGQWTISDPLPFTLHTLYSIILIMTVFTTTHLCYWNRKLMWIQSHAGSVTLTAKSQKKSTYTSRRKSKSRKIVR